MNITATLANHLFLALHRSGNRALLKACEDPAGVQKDVLFSILRKNAASEFGRQHGFDQIKTIEEFQARVPLSTYDDYLPAITRIMQGEKSVLCTGEVDYFTLSSGSAAASKYVPYTKSLKAEFSKAVNPWIFDLLKNYRSLRYGTQFWIITPSTLPDSLPESTIPIGFEEDRNYFGRIGRFLIQSVMNLPGAISRIRDHENYFYLLSCCLLSDKDLRLISVWNPGLLMIILKYISDHYREICDDLAGGQLHLPNPDLQRDVEIANSCRSNTSRRGRYLSGLSGFGPSTLPKIWPRLRLISCWTDGWAGDLIPELKRALPGIEIQGKGLLATEGVISIPLKKLPYPLLCLPSQFYEFKSLSDAKIYLAHELQSDEQYEVMLTGSGGFYRYTLEDIIEVKGFYRKTPMLRFISKRSRISDLCGEKLHEAFVAGVLQKLSPKYLPRQTYRYLAPVSEKGVFCYQLVVEQGNAVLPPEKEEWMKELDRELMQNYHYKHCRAMQQLGAPRLKILNAEEALADQKRRLGSDVSGTKKFSYLETLPKRRDA